MRRVFVVLALLAMMAGLNTLKQEDSGGDPLTLAAIGFVVLAAFALAEIGARASLPKVTGYILSGVVLGPFAANVISSSVVGELKMFSTLALGLIATTAGLELDLRALARLTRTLGVTIGVKLVTGIVLVGGALVAFEQATGALGLENMGTMVAVALVFGALSLGTSPAIVLAVQAESGAKGRLSEIVMGAAVVKDVIVVVALAIALAAGKAIIGGGEIGGEVLLHVGEELGASVLAGALLGGLLIAYLRWVKTEMLLFVAAMVLVVAEISAVLHLELLLVFIVAGVAVRNFSPYEHDLLHPLQTISLPVFIVFFTNAGASIDLGATWTLLPLALVLCVARALGFFAAGRIGGKAGGEPDKVRTLAWLGYLPQAGVTLGLVGLAAASLPDQAEPIATLGMAVVAVNLLVGPVTLRMALQSAGETGATQGAATDSEGAASVALPVEVPSSLEIPDTLEPESLRSLVHELTQDLQTSWTSWQQGPLDKSLTRWHGAFIAQDEAEPPKDEPAAAVAKRLANLVDASSDEDRAAALRVVLDEHVDRLETLPTRIVVPLEPHHARVAKDDTRRMRWSKRLSWLGATLRGHRKDRTRAVSVRMSARVLVEPLMAQLAETNLRSWQRHEAECLLWIERMGQGHHAPDEFDAARETLQQQLRATLDTNRQLALAQVVQQLAALWSQTGAPGVGRPPRYSQIERELRATVQRIDTDAVAWKDVRTAAVERLRFTTHSELVEHRVRVRLVRDLLDPLDQAFNRLTVLIEDQRHRLERLPKTAEVETDEDWSRLEARVHALLPRPTAKELRTLGSKVRRAASADGAGSEIRAFMASEAQSLTVVPEIRDLAKAERPATTKTASIDPRELIEVQLAGEVLPLLERHSSDAASAFASARDQMHEVTSLLSFGLESSLRDREHDGHTVLFDEALARGGEILTALVEGPCTQWEKARAQISEAIEGMSRQLCALAAASAGGRIDGPGSPRPVGRLDRARRIARQWHTETIRRLRAVFRALRSGEVGQAAGDLAMRYRLRSGLQRLDARAISAYLDEQRSARATKLGGLVASLFSTEPLRDPRLFVFNRDGLNSLVHAERAWQAKPDAGNAALIVGDSGSGKSSMLGIARLKLGTRRVVSLRGPDSTTDGLIAALGSALGAVNDEDAIVSSLRRGKTVVLIDDIQRFFPPTPSGLEQLERFVSLVVRTQTNTFWIVAMAGEAVRTWQSLVPLDDAFACRVPLRGPEPSELAAIVDARSELGGQHCVYPRPRSLVGRILGRSPQEAYVRRLCTASSGNLRRALALWGAHAVPRETEIVLQAPSSLSWRLPFVQQLREEVQAILSLLVRHGAQPPEVVATACGLTEAQVAVHLRFLVASALVRQQSGRYLLDAFAVDDVVMALREGGALEGGA